MFHQSIPLTLTILGNKEILRKPQIWVETWPSPQSLIQKLDFANSIQKTRKSQYQTFLVLSSFTRFLYLFKIFLLGFSEQTNFWS